MTEHPPLSSIVKSSRLSIVESSQKFPLSVSLHVFHCMGMRLVRMGWQRQTNTLSASAGELEETPWATTLSLII